MVVYNKKLAVVNVIAVEGIAWTPTRTLGMAWTVLFARFRLFETFRFAALARAVGDAVMQCFNKCGLKLLFSEY